MVIGGSSLKGCAVQPYEFLVVYVRDSFLLRIHLFDRVQQVCVTQDELDRRLGGVYDEFLIGRTQLAGQYAALLGLQDQTIVVLIQLRDALVEFPYRRHGALCNGRGQCEAGNELRHLLARVYKPEWLSSSPQSLGWMLSADIFTDFEAVQGRINVILVLNGS